MDAWEAKQQWYRSQGRLAVGKAVATRREVNAIVASVVWAFVQACISAVDAAPPLIVTTKVLAGVCPNGGHLCMMQESHM
jgi:hypothetical protein